MQGIKIQTNPEADGRQDDDKPPISFAAAFYLRRCYFFRFGSFYIFIFLARFSHRCNLVVAFRGSGFTVQGYLALVGFGRAGCPSNKAKAIHSGNNCQTHVLIE